MSKRTISGRTVVITGAASGIGRALAQRLSAHSCPVAIADVDEARPEGDRGVTARARAVAGARRQ